MFEEISKLASAFYKQSFEKMDYLFVYGTLKHHQEASGQLKGAKFLGTVHTKPKYSLATFNKNYKGLMLHGNDSIEGELYEVTPEQLMNLDQYELEIYSREKIELDNDMIVDAYVFKPELLKYYSENIEFLKGFD